MASLQKRKRQGKDAFLIQFSLDKKRKTVFLGARYSRSFAEEIKRIIENCISAIATGAPLDRQTFAWLSEMSDDLRARFESAGLVKTRESPTLAKIFDAYFLAKKGKIKDNTYRNKKNSERRFFLQIDRATNIVDLTSETIDEIAVQLSKEGAEATCAGILANVKSVFNWAEKKKIIDENPFKDFRVGSRKNKKLEFFITREVYDRIQAFAPSQEMRALLALLRIGGFRKGEAFLAQWSDVDFSRGQMVVHSPKTATKGRATRIIPLFPELRNELKNLFDSLSDKASPEIIKRIRYTTAHRAIKRWVQTAKLEPWPRLLQNLRASRSNEIYRDFGPIAESEWIGHSQKTAKDHYLHTLRTDFDRAICGTTSHEPTTELSSRLQPSF